MPDTCGLPGGIGLLPPAERGSQAWVSGRAVREVGKECESRRHHTGTEGAAGRPPYQANILTAWHASTFESRPWCPA